MCYSTVCRVNETGQPEPLRSTSTRRQDLRACARARARGSQTGPRPGIALARVVLAACAAHACWRAAPPVLDDPRRRARVRGRTRRARVVIRPRRPPRRRQAARGVEDAERREAARVGTEVAHRQRGRPPRALVGGSERRLYVPHAIDAAVPPEMRVPEDVDVGLEGGHAAAEGARAHRLHE